MLDGSGTAAEPPPADAPPRLDAPPDDPPASDARLELPPVLEPNESLGASDPATAKTPPDMASGLPLASEASIVTRPIWVASVPPMTSAVCTM